ncbi:LysM peptidoglycan-binding domain-containing protein [Neobacillus ginsengisoli]|uniref:LysM repeat protein n=1 Tax=Neobacillus ginsengisoli TaxID=904295 RepID=A0ABT9XQB8_9BACI|nr:LysM peptidoglycan-binding domain-containing protein [Neobacillus ginsengisoli]MDQ0197749.1 LysM repeat protein [Neobacillus ginsengisoli]
MKKNFVLVFSMILIMLINISPAHASGSNFSNIYDVKTGDTLWRIAAKYDASVQDLKATNGLISDSLLVGQKLWVPMIYEVGTGDTLWKLSSAYNSSVQMIKTANGLSSDVIRKGQKLKIPPKRMTMQGQYILMTKEEFKDWLFHNKFTRKISLIQEHNTWSPSYKNFNGSNHFSLLKGMENYHVNVMGWKNISQHLTTFPDGKVVVCRPINTAPEGSFGLKNKPVGLAIESKSLAIENLGNFDIGNDVMTQKQKETIVYITALLGLKFGLTPSIDSITYHHWWDINTGERVLDNSSGHAVKTCPGTGFFGGNSTNSAKTHFYPLVSHKMQEILASMH